MMSLLSIKHVFGIRTLLPDCLAYLDEHCYLYPSSRHIILYNTDYKCQRLINYGNELDILESLSVSPNKQLLSIALSTLDKCRIIIYDVGGSITTPVRRRKVLSSSHAIRSIHVLSLIFSANSKFLLALYGAPDYILICWSTDRFKSVATTALHFLHIDLSHNPLNLQVSFNPIDSFQLLITGNHVFRRYRLTNNRFSVHGQGQFQRCESMNITCHCWLNENNILLGLDTGYICTVNKHGDIIQRYNVTTAGESNNLLYRSLNALSIDRFHSRNVSDTSISNRRNISRTKSTSQLSSTVIFDRQPSSAITLGGHHQRRRRNSSRQSNASLFNPSPKTELINRNEIICLLPFSRGVFVSTAAGRVVMYERSENSDRLTYLRRLILPSSTTDDLSAKKTHKQLIETKTHHKSMSMGLYKRRSSGNILPSSSLFIHDVSASTGRLLHSSTKIIRSLALSPNEETLLAGTNDNHLYEIAFSKMDYTKKDASIFTLALDAAHNGAILTGAVCIRKPILFTLGIDRCLKIWNLQTNNQELNHQFEVEPLSLTVHPTGIFVCISFLDTVRIYGNTIDGLTLFKELEISNTRCIEYSNEGHLLAIAYDNILQLHQHSDYDQVTYVRASAKKFRLIRWTRDDAFIISIDFDDLVIRWDPYTCQRISEYRIVDFSVQDFFISPDNKLAYLVGSDKKIKEFLLMTTIRDIDIPFDGCVPTAVSVNNGARDLFLGSQKGSIYPIKLVQTNSMVDTNTHELLQMNVHHGAITKILISFNNDLLISTGEDGNLIIYNLNEYQQNKESKRIFRDEILIKEVLLKEQNIEVNNLIKREYEIAHEYENQVEIKEDEYIEHLRQLDLHCQSHINSMEIKLTELRLQKLNLKNKHEQQLNQLVRDKQSTINEYTDEKSKHLKQVVRRDQLLKVETDNLKINENQQMELTNDLYDRNVELIHLSYRHNLNTIKNKFFKEHLNINERIDHLEEMKNTFDEDAQIELNEIRQQYETKLRIIRNKIEQLENEEVLLRKRLQQLEEESNRFEDAMKQFEIQRNQLIDHIRQVDNDLNLAKQTIQQRHFIIQEKLKRTNEMENRRDELEKFAYVFNYKIRELTSQIGPRQHEVQALIEQFNNMDNEYDLFSKNNEKYSIKIADYKARLRAIEKELQNETQAIRKLNETATNMKEDLKFCCHLIDQPKELIKIIQKLYGKYILYIDTISINFGQMNLFDGDRQRTYFERTNQRLQTKISIDIKREKFEQIRRIQEQISMMREISTYSLKVVEVERILSDLDIVSNIAMKMNATTSNEILHALRLEQGSDFIQEKQTEFNSILNKQQKRIEQLRNFVQKIEQHLQGTHDQCETGLTLNLLSNSSIDQSTIMSSNSIHS